MNMSLNRKFLVLLLGLFFIPNILISQMVELSFDESYYWIYSQFLNFGYYDHPPMVAISILIGNFLLGHNEFAVRLLPNLYLLGTVWVLWSMVRDRKNSVLFVLMLFSMPLVNLTGFVALPDAPLMFFSALFFKMIKEYLNKDNLKNTILLSLVIAAMFYSKYHGLLIVLLTVLANLNFLKRKSFWIVVGLVCLLYAPHIWWQYTHDFVTFKFHLFKRNEKHFNLKNIFEYVGSQVLLMGFLNFFLFIYIFYKNKFKDVFERILLFNSMGFLLFLFVMSLRNQIEANWTISCSLALIILMLPYVENHKKLFIKFACINLGMNLVLKSVLLFPGYFVNASTKENRINEIYGWKEGRITQILDICDGKEIVGDNYQVTSKLAFYTKNPNIPALHFGSRESQYSILNISKNLIGNIPENREICYLTSKNLPNSVKIETKYKDPVYILPNTSLGKLAKRYNTTYEKIIREKKY